MLQEINWNNFKAKFNGKENEAFQHLCYLLFCKEFSKDSGISRFKNHAGIENDPVEKDGQIIGWQAKFYTAGLSAKKKSDFTKSVDTTNTRHPNVNRIIFYINEDFGQNPKGTDPQYKKEIEDYSKSKGIEIEWRTASYFESPFVCEENFSIAQYFFSLKKGVIASIKSLSSHTESLLKQIQSEIAINDAVIKLDRSVVISEVKESLTNFPLLILSGNAGVGKTALIKDFYKSVNTESPVFMFKAAQFNGISTADELLKSFGEITLSEFINEHTDFDKKIIIIDSAEKLADIENQEIFQTILSTLLNNGWNIIFTVRYNYLDDLKFQLEEIYNISPKSLNIPNLSADDLESVSSEYNFQLPKKERLQQLLQIPLYLNEWLRSYKEVEPDISYHDFRDHIWREKIQHSTFQKDNIHIRREECFLKISKERASQGGLFVKTDGYDHGALSKLNQDGIIGYDNAFGGYFITHDIYEEWALDKIIERTFCSVQEYKQFYREIGSSLPIRRAFRNWLSDKLFISNEKAKELIEFTIDNTRIDKHWKDEALVSVLLSDYACTFFEQFEDRLLKKPEKIVSQDSSSEIVRSISVTYNYDNCLLNRVLFLLRIACKTIDEDFLHLLGVTKTEGIALKTVFTTPKGKGWECAIAFVNNHKEKLQFQYMNVILPVLDDWNNKNKEGEATRHAAQMALFYYKEFTKEEGSYFSPRDNTKDRLIRTIFNGSSEIKDELGVIFNEVITKKDVSHRSQYYELIKVAMGPLFESAVIAQNLPKEVMQLANLFWFYTPRETTSWHPDYRNDIGQYFDLADEHLEYYPASAFQTPTFRLLQTDPKASVDFILSFVNRAVEYFAKSEFAQYESEEIDVVIDESSNTIKQYICRRIWNLYRGTQTAPHLFESVHMALERWLLMVAKTATPEILEEWCLYLIKNSRSASITAIVVSIVLAEPAKLFNIAQILFRTKEFFFYDTARMQLDMTAKSMYSISNDREGMFKDERLKTCEDKHRSFTLENQALSYQVFASEDEGEEVAKKRQEILWKIFDDYYDRLPDKLKEIENDKTWRLYLARMDKRKMNITTEKKDDQVLINFNPDIDPELQKYSEDSLAKSSEVMKYTPLQLWSRYRFERNESEYQKYPQYNNGHKLIISDTKEIIKGLKNDESEEKTFTLFYLPVPPYTCAVLVRDYFSQLDKNERDFCIDTILEYASKPLRDEYRYQIGDGVDVAIKVLPSLIKYFPKKIKIVKETLLYSLFNSYPVGMSARLSDYVVAGILQNMWKDSPEDANSMFLGYLILKPKFDEISEVIREENRKNNEYGFSYTSAVERFAEDYKTEVSKVVSNQVTFSDIPDIKNAEPEILITAFSLLPLGTTDKDHKLFVKEILSVILKAVKANERSERLDYSVEHLFLEKLAYFVLSSKEDDIQSYLEPLINSLDDSKETYKFLDELVIAEDGLKKCEEFWFIWELFYPKIVDLCKSGNQRWYLKNIIWSYLFASQPWNKEAEGWHSFREQEKSFFKKVAQEIGGYPSVLYSLSKLLNEIGKSFVDDGIFWISDILKNNPGLVSKELEINTVYYLENIVRGYILRNRRKVKTDITIKNRILEILNFLIAKESATGYLLREDIL